MATNTDNIRLSFDEVRQLAEQPLLNCGISREHADAMADVVALAEADEARSHGLYRIPGCVQAVRSGKVAPRAEPEVTASAGAVVRMDARCGFALYPLRAGQPLLVDKARQFGLAALALNNCYHFSALWADVERLAESGMVALSCTIGAHNVALAGGSAPAFGTNPLAFAFPRGAGRKPFVFDLSSSVVAKGEIELRRRSGMPLPPGWAVDREGALTTNPDDALNGAILPFGGHKGAALGLMVELLAGPLIGDLRSAEALAIDTHDGGPLRGGYLMLAIDPRHFGGGPGKMEDADAWLTSLAEQHQPARLPGTRRHAARQRSLAQGICIPRVLYDQLLELC
ncbi:Ldh family oxidoreductase [Teichococcus vastitatis]|uniref:Ldh family oxidoreductase n=1 Tax=Teichococcus vastitatis TaxID=2307076 RepID=A0ABS9W9X2_9PROT|nr:Ldh family oxidoreductase [Pseudoroseomonas vastitatis]MCI0755550.1 Ldh family oxidoreductase [Pseudoroseomonas vastitatis]